MPIIIGTDEAGYGPNLGPLVIAATAWHVPDALAGGDLYEVLSDAVCHSANDDRKRIAIADSKKLYKPRGSLAALEAAVHGGLQLLQRSPNSWRSIFETLATDTSNRLPASPWYADYDEALPVDVPVDTVRHCADRLADALKQTGIRLLDLRAAMIFPGEFNARVRQLGSKGSLLTEQTLQLVDDVLTVCPRDDARIYCDKHGGRNRYATAMQHIWPDSEIDIIAEGRACSEYAIEWDGFAIHPDGLQNRPTHGVRFRFAVGGESQLASALASMIAKYLRELAMRAFNAYWQSHVAGLRPTAGYPVDAKRFKQEIETAQRRLKVDDEILWRCK